MMCQMCFSNNNNSGNKVNRLSNIMNWRQFMLRTSFEKQMSKSNSESSCNIRSLQQCAKYSIWNNVMENHKKPVQRMHFLNEISI